MSVHHHVVTMSGRDPREAHRAATPLELLFDLTFVIAFGKAADELAHALAADHLADGIGAFAFCVFGISWAWIQFSWFASAYDTDDWIYRLLTMVQMGGVLLFTLGIADVFSSWHEGEHLDNTVLILGYVVMRVPLVFQWLRASRQDPTRRRQHSAYVVSIVVSQSLWIALALAQLGLRATLVCAVALILVELGGPVVAERGVAGTMTPWHPHHIAERYGLIVIIALGEGLLGTVAALVAIIGPDGPGWSVEVGVLALSGTALIFGMWWIYFALPCAELLERHRERSWGWGYGQIPLLGALVAVGAGLHVATYYVEHHSELGATATVASTAVPLSLYILGVYAIYSTLARTFDSFHVWLVAGTALLLVAPVLLAFAGLPVVWCLAIVALSPWVTVVGYETLGHRHAAAVLQRS